VRASGRLGRGPTLECRKENYAWYTRRLIHSIGVYPGIRSPNDAQGNATQLLYSTDEVAYQKVLTQVTGAQLGLLYTL
jgi:hypothetical protein